MQAEVWNRNIYPIQSITKVNITELFQHPGKEGILVDFFLLLKLAIRNTLIYLTSSF